MERLSFSKEKESFSDFSDTSLEMYQIPGSEDITRHSFERYLRDKEQDKAIKVLAEKERIDNLTIEAIKNSSEKERVSLIEKGLLSDNEKIRKISAEMIKTVLEKDKISLIKKGLSSGDKEVRRISALTISWISEEDRDNLTEMTFDSSDINVNEVGAGLIEDVSEIKRKKLREKLRKIIEKELEGKDLERILVSAEMIDNLPKGVEKDKLKEKLASLVREGIKEEDRDRKMSFIKMMCYLPEEERADTITRELDYPDIKIKELLTKQIFLVSAKHVEDIERVRIKISEIIEDYLLGDNVEEKRISASMIYSSSWEKKLDLIKLSIKSSDYRTILLSINATPEYGREEVTRELLLSKDPKIRRMASRMVMFLDKGSVVDFMKKGLDDESREVQREFTKFITLIYLEKREREELIDICVKKGLSNYLIENPLYEDKEINKENFVRENFQKTGSKTTLIGGKLKDKTIIREISPEAFVSWQNLFEDYKTWKEEGFDYVPIEPIQSYKLKENGLVDVYTGVLDLNMSEWIRIFGKFEKELKKDIENIGNVLIKKGISHNHPHDKNFILRFYRDKQGNADLTRKPRVYLIDFDEAISL